MPHRGRRVPILGLIAIQCVFFAVAGVLAAGGLPSLTIAIPAALSALASVMITRKLASQLEETVARANVDLEQKSRALAQEQGELATVMTAIADGILAVGLDGRPLFYNSSLAMLFLDRSLEERRPTLTEIFRDPGVLEAYTTVLKENRTLETGLSLMIRNDPQAPHFFSLSIAPLRNQDGTVYGAVGIFHDVTELKRAEQIRMEFVANVSHELRTPLTAIKGYTDTLIQDVAAGQFSAAGKFLGIVARNVDRLMQLIEDLLSLSALESGEGHEGLNLQPVATKELTERVLAALDPARRAKYHEIVAQYGVSHVYADPARAEQVLTNLLENAIKYVPETGRIRVEWASNQNPNGVSLIVADNGPGIPAEALPRLFERFFRVDKARSRELGGTGLGLAIVKHILQRHGGSVSVTSSPEQGTAFRCYFPG